MNNINEDKRQGAVLGHALGDALGAPVEFYPFAHYSGILNTPITRYTRAYGKQASSIGQTTDDTEMALVLLKTIYSDTGYTKEKAIVNYMIWANNNFEDCKGKTPFMGKNTRNLLVAPKPTVKLYMNRFRKYYPDETTKENSQSNGALMRSYPLAFVEDDDIIKLDTEITNPSKLSYNAVYVYVTAIKMALSGKTKKNIKKRIRNLIKFDELKIAYEQACNNQFRDVTKKRGHVVHGFYCAFWGLFQFDNYKSAIDAIICLTPELNIKPKFVEPGQYKKKDIVVGDTDTNAAIAGALMGAYYGIEKLNEDEITRGNIEILLSCDSSKGGIVRPKEYEIGQYFKN
jgi:ADP-ribosyl-[dinitrogen reductase] hydrolase